MLFSRPRVKTFVEVTIGASKLWLTDKLSSMVAYTKCKSFIEQGAGTVCYSLVKKYCSYETEDSPKQAFHSIPISGQRNSSPSQFNVLQTTLSTCRSNVPNERCRTLFLNPACARFLSCDLHT